jgi:hypothetical protein
MFTYAIFDLNDSDAQMAPVNPPKPEYTLLPPAQDRIKAAQLQPPLPKGSDDSSIDGGETTPTSIETSKTAQEGWESW